MRRIAIALIVHLSLCVALCRAAETLNVDFTGPKNLQLGGKQYTIDGNFSEGKFIAIGSRGYSLPASNLVGDNKGSIFFAFKISEMQPPVNIQRILLALRTNGRLTLGFNYYGDRSIQLAFAELTNGILFEFPVKIEIGKEYNLGCTWDGTVVRIYLEGRMIAEKAQPHAFNTDRLRNFNIGPYKDSWFAPRPWADDTFVKYLRVHNDALSPAEVAAMYNVEFQPIAKSHPQFLCIPRVPDGMAAPKNDGKLDEPVWKLAASMPAMIDIIYPEKSGLIPQSSFKLLHDDKNIYLGLTSVFPSGAQLKEGQLRTDAEEPNAWTDESFEFYVRHGGNTFHFIGNVAGGYMERRNSDKSWNGRWLFTSTKEMKIDSSTLWQGEVEIPWSTLELQGPPSEPVGINYCRSWKLPECGAFSAVLNEPEYAPADSRLVLARFSNVPALQMLEQNNPNSGAYSIKFQVGSVDGGQAVYDVALGRLDGRAQPMSVLHRTYNLNPKETLQDEQLININTNGYDCIVHSLHGKSGLAMREVVPFKLNEEYFGVVPFFLHGRIQVNLRMQMMKSKLGADFNGKLALVAPDGSVLVSAAADKEEVLLPFDKATAAAGKYKVALLDAKGETAAAVELNYPGLGEWARQDFTPERIIPPFITMESKIGEASLESAVLCRKYIWNRSFLPTQIEATDEKLFAAPAAVLQDGAELKADSFSTTFAKPHRAEFTVSSKTLKMKSWLEYDGVQWNEIAFTPEKAGGSLDLQFRFPAPVAKYLHATYCHNWGSKITRLLPDGKLELNWMPIVWIGNEEKGFCFFAEERNGWNSPSNHTYTINKGADGVTLTVHIWSRLKDTAERKAAFGIVASPVKRIAEQPFDTFNFDTIAPLNRPNRRPTSEILYLTSERGGDLGNFFGDMDNPYAAKVRNAQKKMLDKLTGQPAVRPMSYTAAKYLSEKYPEVAAFLPEWKKKPEFSMDYEHTSHFVYECCMTTLASDFFVWKVKDMLRRNPGMKGVYFDFATVSECSNAAHGCDNRVTILAFREYFRRIAVAQLEAGIERPAIVIHNTDYVMVPCYTFVTNLLNGEHFRQASSSILHNGKDIIDSLPLELFATELSSLPFGITNSVYLPFDQLIPKYGGTEEGEPYKFRMGKAALAMTLPHHTFPAQIRNHFGLFDKLVRIYDDFGVGNAKFIGYWRNPAKVGGGHGILVSCYVVPNENKVLAVIGHTGKPHDNQDFSVSFDWKALGISKAPTKATDMMTAPDKDYGWLFEQRRKYNIPVSSAPLEIGDFGSIVNSFDGNTLKMHLDYHCFAIVLLN